MSPSPDDLRPLLDLLRRLLREVELHGEEYHYRTPERLVEFARSELERWVARSERHTHE